MWRLPSSPVGGTSRQMQHRKLCGTWCARVSLPPGSEKRKPSSAAVSDTPQFLRFYHAVCSLYVRGGSPYLELPLLVELLCIPQGPTSKGSSGEPAVQNALSSISGFIGLGVTPLLPPGLGSQAGLPIPCVANPGPIRGPANCLCLSRHRAPGVCQRWLGDE